MYTHKKFSHAPAKTLNDDEYLALQIWQLQHIFNGMLGAIKNIDLNYIAMNEAYATEFGLTKKLQILENSILIDAEGFISADIEQQEQAIIKNQEFQDSIFLYRTSKLKLLSGYIVRKRPIVNPATNQTLGIFIISIKHKFGQFRIQQIKQLIGFASAAKNASTREEPLSDQSLQIILCLLYGFHSRKEIAAIISENTNSEINETKIKNQLRALYEKFECSSSTQLMQAIINNDLQIKLPLNSVQAGNYPLK